MRFRLAIPKEISQTISSWGLPRRILVWLYTDLHALAPKHLDECMRLAAPTPTFVHNFELYDDEQLPLVIHCFTFWFTYGDQEGVLYARDCSHRIDDSDYPRGVGDEPT